MLHVVLALHSSKLEDVMSVLGLASKWKLWAWVMLVQVLLQVPLNLSGLRSNISELHGDVIQFLVLWSVLWTEIVSSEKSFLGLNCLSVFSFLFSYRRSFLRNLYYFLPRSCNPSPIFEVLSQKFLSNLIYLFWRLLALFRLCILDLFQYLDFMFQNLRVHFMHLYLESIRLTDGWLMAFLRILFSQHFWFWQVCLVLIVPILLIHKR